MNKRRRESGVALAVTLFMLGLLTVIGVSAIMLSTSHFRLVGNLQAANEAEMAVREAVECVACEKAGAACNPLSYQCKKVAIRVNGRPINVEIRTRCVGVSRGDTEGGTISGTPILDTHWEITGISETGIAGRLGIVAPKSGACPPTVIPTCSAPASVPCN